MPKGDSGAGTGARPVARPAASDAAAFPEVGEGFGAEPALIVVGFGTSGFPEPADVAGVAPGGLPEAAVPAVPGPLGIPEAPDVGVPRESDAPAATVLGVGPGAPEPPAGVLDDLVVTVLREPGPGVTVLCCPVPGRSPPPDAAGCGGFTAWPPPVDGMSAV
ncbi:hypothetical protein Aph02nite_42820 [Actinoplanes philippinensis]|nr:hypothetical protein Aph02nite_42820 [Actinoplanes philippinensis]